MNLIRKVISIVREKALKIFGRKNGIYYINGSETLPPPPKAVPLGKVA